MTIISIIYWEIYGKLDKNDINITMTKEDKTKRTEKLEYLKKNVFFGLKNMNDGFDSMSIYYFSESDFEIVINRVEKYGIGILGIEPWLNGEFYDVKVAEDYEAEPTDSKWYRKAFVEFKNTTGKNLLYAASYEIL